MGAISLAHDGLDGGRVMGMMLFPNRPDLREAHFAREVIRQILDAREHEDSRLVIERSTMRALLEAPSRTEMSAHAAEATKRGSVAGDLLALVYEMHSRGTDWPSFGKAIRAYKEFAIGRRYGDGDPLKYSEAQLRRYWSEYKPVAHLWAAFRLNFGPFAYLDSPRDVFHESVALQQFLGVARGAADFICSYVPKGARPARPLIEPEDLVALPHSIPAKRLIFRPAEDT